MPDAKWLRAVTMIESSDLRTTRIPLNQGAGHMPALGFGTLIPDAALTITATRDALEAGFRHFDCAERYGNEREVGSALQAGSAAGDIAREAAVVSHPCSCSRRFRNESGNAGVHDWIQALSGLNATDFVPITKRQMRARMRESVTGPISPEALGTHRRRPTFFERFVVSIQGIKLDTALTLQGAKAGGADYLLSNRIIAELKIWERDAWDSYNSKVGTLFDRHIASGELRCDINPEKVSLSDPEIPPAMRLAWESILLKPILTKFWEADEQIAEGRKVVPDAKGLLLLLNIGNRLHAEPLRLFWLVKDKVLTGAACPNIDAWAYFCLPVPELMRSGVNQSIFWGHFTRSENYTPGGWKDQILLMKCRGLEEQWQDFLRQELGIPIRNIPESEVRWPKP
jgi:hypothetical protein